MTKKTKVTKQSDKKICFVISPIGEEESETRKRSDQVLRHIISGPVEGLGYEIIRADKISEPGIITSQIIEYIVDAELVVADLTERNPNVFYELALRHAARKPLVQLIKKGETIPFDVAATRIIQFDLQNLDSVESAKTELIAQVKSLEAGKNNTDNPVSVSLDLKMLKESGDPEERSLADIVEAISELRLTLTSSVEKGLVSSKAFQEFRSMFEELRERFDYDFRRRRRRFHPMMFEEILHMSGKPGDPMGMLMAAGFIRDIAPWLYELAMESYQAIKSGRVESMKVELNRVRQLYESKMFMVFSEEFGYSDKESHIIVREFPRFMEHALSDAIAFAKAKATQGRSRARGTPKASKES